MIRANFCEKENRRINTRSSGSNTKSEITERKESRF